MELGKEKKFVNVSSLILWLFEQELEKTVDIYEAYKNTGEKMYHLLVKNRFFRIYKVHANNESGVSLISYLPNALDIVVDFLRKINSNEYYICNMYAKALQEIDLVACLPEKANSSLYNIDVSPNHALYKEIETIIDTFTFNPAVTDLVEFFLFSLLRRWGNPKLDISTVRGIKEFQAIEYVKTDFSDIQFNIALKRNSSDSKYRKFNNEDLNRLRIDLTEKENDLLKCKKELDGLLKDNKHLKDSLEKSKEQVTKLELMIIDGLKPEFEIPVTRTRNNVLKIIAILADMADLSDHPYTAYTMMEAHARLKNLEIPSKTPVADWIRKARNSN